VRISLRELLICVALVALAIVSLKYANDLLLALVSVAAMIALFAGLIVAVVDRGPRQVFAIGFALVMISYGAFVLNGQRAPSGGGSRNLEFDPYSGQLPTTRLLRFFYQAIVRVSFYDQQTGKHLPNYDPEKAQQDAASGIGSGGGINMSIREDPPREIFMPIGHCWWALVLGYAGGWFARYVYARRTKELSPIPR